MRPNPHIALIYHYDLARALAGEVVDWQAIPVIATVATQASVGGFRRVRNPQVRCCV